MDYADIDAVLFDMDGTLSDTQRFWYESNAHVIELHGTRSPDPLANAEPGNSLETAGRYLREHHGVPMSDPQIAEVSEAFVVSRIREGFDWMPHARELLAALRERAIPTALVTSSPPAVVQAILAAAPEHVFDSVVTSADVAAQKPDPAPYAFAAASLGVVPGRCLAVEDSAVGATSAVAAGCRTMVVTADPDSATIVAGAERIGSLADLL